ncbi:MAG: HD domain-containing protein [Treponemataceae bacterium]|nr:HD domain-containing protein [Treponemataceae bacterium]
MTKLEAVIEIGSTGIRLAIAEIAPDNSWSFIDHSELPVALGWDVFTTSLVSRETLVQCLQILNRFKEQIANWQIENAHITIVATSALREARNRDAVLDRIRIKTGFSVKIIDGIEENRLMYVAILNALQNQLPRFNKLNSIILDVGGGSTEIMLLHHGEMVAVHSLRLGTVIIEQHIKAMMGSQKDARRFLEEYINNTGGNLNKELSLAKVHQFVATGQEAQLVAKEIGTSVSDNCWIINREAFQEFVTKIQSYSIDECIAHFKIPYAEARALTINLLTYQLFINLTAAEEILVVKSSIREGIIASKYTSPNTELQENFASQVTASALNLCRKFRIDETHAQYVRTIALKFYDTLQDELGFEGRERLLLEVAALLHDVGTFIRSQNHEMHSLYIISNSEIFGLSKDDMIIVSQVARYHKGAPPSASDTRFYSLSPHDRITVQKLAAILRIADALDRGHTQRIKDIKIELKNEAMHLVVNRTYDTTLERNALTEKADLFENIFGYKVILH